MNWASARNFCGLLALAGLGSTEAFACGEDGFVRPRGSDHLLYTVERGAEDITSLNGRKFRLIVSEPGVERLTISPEGAFRVTEVARFNGNTTYNAEIVDANALYTRESWGDFPRHLTFAVECDPAAAMRTADASANAQVAERTNPYALTAQADVDLIPDTVLPPVVESDTSPAISSYKVKSIESASLPPLPKAEPVVEPEPEEAEVETPAPVEVASLGTPGTGLAPADLQRIIIDFIPGRKEPSAGGKTRLDYQLVVRNALSRNVQCDIHVESSYLRSFGSGELAPVDSHVHEGVQIRARSFRKDLKGEIEYFPNVLGGDRWMSQNHWAPEKGGLRAVNCVALQG